MTIAAAAAGPVLRRDVVDAPALRASRRLPPHVRVTDDAEGLAAVRRRGVNLRLWMRTLPEPIVAGLASAVSAGFPSLRRVGTSTEICTEFRRLMPPTATSEWLTSDAVMLIEVYAALTGERRVTLRLEAITGDACRFFHADNVALRLVTTYQGRGTHWLAEADADAFAGGAVPEDRVHEVPTGAVAVFKGLRCAATAHSLVHRSPPRRPGDAVRLFLAIDPAPFA